MDVINLKHESDTIKELDKYFVIGKMNNYNFTLIKANNRKLDWHTHLETDEVFYVLEGK
jgi:mannose-6-phosphate isomerase-like protein (cupin superfamily)